MTLPDKTLVIDCDPGCDDALALLLAIRSGIYQKIIITTVAGNVPVNRTTHNACKIAALATHGLEKRPEIEIYRGSAISLMGTAPNVTSVHGRDGLGDVPLKLYPQGVRKAEGNPSVEKRSAVEFLKDMVPEGGTCDLVCTGPLTNIANAISLSPDPQQLLMKFDKIVVMGGVFKHRGNITPSAEYNFFFDPVAVKIVLDVIKKADEKDKKLLMDKVVFVPLDVTERAQLRWDDIENVRKNEVGIWVSAMLQKYFQFHVYGAQVIADIKDTYEEALRTEKLSSLLFKKDDDYKTIWKKVRDARMRGKSGNKLLPRFSYLHDPLAVYFTMNYDLTLTEDAPIAIHTGDDSMRGSVIIVDEKVSLSTRPAYTKGTKVRYLTPDKVLLRYAAEFKRTLQDACGFQTQREQDKT